MALNLNKVSLRMSAGLPEQFPRDPIPQVAFSGRSNVGKSSLINCLLGRKSLARVSSAPGKTITINFYELDEKLFFVDLPGYGFAKRAPGEKAKWSSLTDGFFTKNKNRDRSSSCNWWTVASVPPLTMNSCSPSSKNRAFRLSSWQPKPISSTLPNERKRRNFSPTIL